LQYIKNLKKFLDGEGLHLMNLMLKEKKMSRNSALKVINHAVSGKEGKENCEKFVEILGLRSIFPLFMRPPKRNKKTGHTENDHEEAIMSILGNLMRNMDGSVRERLVNKFIETDHAKCDRLLELHFKYLEKNEKADEDIIKQQIMLRKEGQEMDDDMIYIQKLEKGLFTLQQIDYIIVELYGTGIESLKDRIMTHLSMRKSSLRQIREIIKEYADNLGDGEDPEAEEAERQRLLALAMSL
jgi:beta-catenin-like protein 1